jgi:hypothetical protein
LATLELPVLLVTLAQQVSKDDKVFRVLKDLKDLKVAKV